MSRKQLIYGRWFNYINNVLNINGIHSQQEVEKFRFLFSQKTSNYTLTFTIQRHRKIKSKEMDKNVPW